MCEYARSQKIGSAILNISWSLLNLSHLVYLQAREARARIPEQVYYYGSYVLVRYGGRLNVDESKYTSINSQHLISAWNFHLKLL